MSDVHEEMEELRQQIRVLKSRLSRYTDTRPIDEDGLREEVERLRQTIRGARFYLKDYHLDSESATHAKRMLDNAIHTFDALGTGGGGDTNTNSNEGE